MERDDAGVTRLKLLAHRAVAVNMPLQTGRSLRRQRTKKVWTFFCAEPPHEGDMARQSGLCRGRVFRQKIGDEVRTERQTRLYGRADCNPFTQNGSPFVSPFIKLEGPSRSLPRMKGGDDWNPEQAGGQPAENSGFVSVHVQEVRPVLGKCLDEAWERAAQNPERQVGCRKLAEPRTISVITVEHGLCGNAPLTQTLQQDRDVAFGAADRPAIDKVPDHGTPGLL